MASFERAVEFTLAQEGVFSNDTNDRGGKTKYGIIEEELIAYQRTTGRLRGRRIEDLTRDEAIEMYRSAYWRYDGVQSDMIATKLFDMGVNMGRSTAVKLAQAAYNFTFPGSEIAVDGAWGTQTLSAVNEACRTKRLMYFKALCLFSADRYVKITFGNRTQVSFIDGWLTRAARRPRD